jgi:hypothetical protein
MNKLKSDSITVQFLDGNDTIVLKKPKGSSVFLANEDSFIVSKSTLIIILKYLMEYDIISPAVLEGLLEERFTK